MTISLKTHTEHKKTALWDLHIEQKAKMVDFAGYDMPVQYSMGVKAEHLHVRAKAGLFDVSHMGQAYLYSKDKTDPALLLEKIVPSDIASLEIGALRYTVLLNDKGGIVDDLMVARLADDLLYLVVNASCKEADFDYVKTELGERIGLKVLEDYALCALQGPKAEEVLRHVVGQEAAALTFMHAMEVEFEGTPVYIARSGYTGEDGFEISAPKNCAMAIAKAFLEHEDVELIGLGARDSLRLESGLCLYGHDITRETTPVDAGLNFVIAKNRRAKCDFAGGEYISQQLEGQNISQKRVGVLPEGRAPIREGVELFDVTGQIKIGQITSGGFSPQLEVPIAMGYVDLSYAELNTEIMASLRGKMKKCHIAKMPFIPPSYKR